MTEVEGWGGGGGEGLGAACSTLEEYELRYLLHSTQTSAHLVVGLHCVMNQTTNVDHLSCCSACITVQSYKLLPLLYAVIQTVSVVCSSLQLISCPSGMGFPLALGQNGLPTAAG